MYGKIKFMFQTFNQPFLSSSKSRNGSERTSAPSEAVARPSALGPPAGEGSAKNEKSYADHLMMIQWDLMVKMVIECDLMAIYLMGFYDVNVI